jgi:hypothetical protein
MTRTKGNYEESVRWLEHALGELEYVCAYIYDAAEAMPDRGTREVIEGHLWRLEAWKAGMEESLGAIGINFRAKEAAQAKQKGEHNEA